MELKELRKLSKNFRIVASRLLKTGYTEAMDNLKIFVSFINTSEVISSFIETNNTRVFDIEHIIKSKGYNRFPIQHNSRDEIAFTYQLLSYASDNYNQYYQLSNGYSSSRMFQDHTDEFNRVVVQPFVQQIISYLDELIIDLSSETTNKGINVQFSGDNNGLISMNNEGTTIISNISISNTDMVEVNKLIELILDLVGKEVSNNQDKDRLFELLSDIKDELLESRPREKNIRKLIDRLTLLNNTIIASVVLSNHLISFIDLIKRFIEAH